MSDYLILIWFIIIIVAAIIEISTMDLTSVWFAIGALFSFIISIFSDNVLLQISVFMIISVILLLSVRPIVKNYFRTNLVNTNADRLVGKTALCTKEIRPGERGEVKIDGKFWTAISNDDDAVLVNEKVEVLAIEGVKLIVVKL